MKRHDARAKSGKPSPLSVEVRLDQRRYHGLFYLAATREIDPNELITVALDEFLDREVGS